MNRAKSAYRKLGRIHKVYHGGRISKDRLISLIDGATAIIITLMVLEIKLPESAKDLTQLQSFGFAILIYFASFVIVGIQWNRHHHILDKVEKITNSFIWKNMIYVFFLSLIPLFMRWVLSSPSEVLPAFCYALIYLLTDLGMRWITASALGENTGFFHGENRKSQRNYHLVRTGSMIIWIAIISLVSIFLPQVEIFFLIILPVATSLFTLFEDEKEENENVR